MGKQLIPHGLDQCFRCFGVVHPERVLGNNLYRCHRHDHQCHNPKILAQIGKTAHLIHQFHNIGVKVTLFAADGTVHSCPDDLWLDHIRQCGHTGAQNAQQEKTFRAFQKTPKKL